MSDVASMLLSVESSTIACIVVASTIDDGVCTLLIVITCCVACAIVALAVVSVSVRKLLLNDADALGAPDEGAVNVTDGDWKRQPLPVSGKSGSTSTILPPACTWPAVVNVTIASCRKPGVSVLASSSADTRAPAAMASVAIDVVVSMVLPVESCVVALTWFASTIDEGVRTLVIVITCCVDCGIVAPAVTTVSVRDEALKNAIALGVPDVGAAYDTAIFPDEPIALLPALLKLPE